jgi:hypothetical protein
MKLILRLHRYNFLLIIGSFLSAIFTVIKFSMLPQLQFLTVLTLIFFYLGWSLIYHLVDKSLNLEITLEYVLTALLAVVVLYGILL